MCDFEPEEIARQLSVSLAVAPFTVDGVKVNLLDAPGYADFAGEMRAALAVADLAVVVVSATDGVQAQTEDAWRAAAALGLPRVVVIDKLDRERADFDRVLAEVRAAFGAGVAPVELPIGAEAAFRGVIDLLDDTATLYELGGGPPVAGDEGPIPDELAVDRARGPRAAGRGHRGRRRRPHGPLPRGRDHRRGPSSEASLAGGVASGAVFPVLCCSGATGVGVDRLARLLVELAPPPDRRPPGHGPRRRHHDRGRLRPGRPAAARGVQDPLGPARRADLAVQGPLGHDPARHRPHQHPDPRPTSGSTCSRPCGATSHHR